MGGEFGQGREWNHDRELDWHLLGIEWHEHLRRWVEALNKFYRTTPAMHELDFSQTGFEWIDCNDMENSVLSLVRKPSSASEQLVVAVLNFTPVPRYDYAVGFPLAGHWREGLNSDAPISRGHGGGEKGRI